MAHRWILGLSIDETLEGALCHVEQKVFAEQAKHPTEIYKNPKTHPEHAEQHPFFGMSKLSLAGDESSPTIDLQSEIEQLLAELKEEHPDEFGEIAAVGISTIGVVDRERSRLRSIKRKAWTTHGVRADRYHVDFRKLFDQALPGRQVKIAIHNDATASCFAEYRWQDPKDRVSRLCYANISQGINIGLIEEGRMDHAGTMRFFHPELGHAYPPIPPADRRFNARHSGCPAHIDCYEGRASRTRIAKQWKKELSELSKTQQKLIAEYAANFCWMAAVAAAPDRLLLGGLVPYPGFIDLVRDAFHRLNAGPSSKRQKDAPGYIDRWAGEQLGSFLQMARLGQAVGVFGALELARDLIDRDVRRPAKRAKGL